MIRGIYSSAAGMIAQYKKINVLGNNVSNMSTPGYKRDDVAIDTFGQEMIKQMGSNQNTGDILDGVGLANEYSDLTTGGYQNTGENTDLAIQGTGFFAVQGVDGATKYTRAGDFEVNAQGFLALPTGERLMGANGPIYVGSNKFNVSLDGTVTTANGTTAQITLYNAPNDRSVQKRKDGFFNIAGVQAGGGVIRQGFLENSNSNAVSEMTKLLESTRAFQGCQQAFQVTNSTIDKLVNQVGTK